MNIKTPIKSKEDISCGACFRDAREQKGVTLEKASQDLKIVRTILEAIEEDNYLSAKKELPPPVYLKGMIKKYAHYLRLDEDKILDFYQKNNNRKISSGEEDLLPQNRFLIARPRFGLVFSFIFRQLIKFSLIIFLFGYFLFELSRFLLPAQIVLYYPPEDLMTSNPNLEISGEVTRSKILYFQNGEINFNEKGLFREQITLNPGSNILELKAVNSLGRETILQQNVVLSIH
ncbi:MAG: helix-turn-helix domain-containing protein [Candidatus Paceibacterota bacterium]|jgi:transcriptional regulator with XRE-family HTH domain